ncbi:hypothetical protein ACWD5V_36990 [Streptomyces sp. NPDC002523]
MLIAGQRARFGPSCAMSAALLRLGSRILFIAGDRSWAGKISDRTAEVGAAPGAWKQAVKAGRQLPQIGDDRILTKAPTGCSSIDY